MATADDLYLQTLAGFKRQQQQYGSATTSQDLSYRKLAKAQAGYGDFERAQLERQFAAAQGQASLAATQRGLGNTTIALNMARGISSDQSLANLALSGQIRGNLNQIEMGRLGYLGNAQQGMAQLQGQELGYMGQNQAAAAQFGYQQQLQAQQAQDQLKQTIAGRMPGPMVVNAARSYGFGGSPYGSAYGQYGSMFNYGYGGQPGQMRF